MIETLATNRTDYSFHEWILPRTPGGCDDFLDLHASYPLAELFAIDLVAIPQKKARRRLFRKGFNDLLRGPDGRLSEISIPSLSNSPWILGAPQSGLVCVISLIKALTSEPIIGRPTLFRRDNLLQ